MIATRILQAVAVSSVLALGVVSCDAPPTDPVPVTGSSDLLGLPPVGLMSCVPLAADSRSVLVGPEGGTMEVGTHRLVIPAGALSDTVTITASAPSSNVNQVTLLPHGLQFAAPATLTMSYANCFGAFLPLPRSIAYTTDLLVVLELLPSLTDLASRTVSTDLDHFSKYAIAW